MLARLKRFADQAIRIIAELQFIIAICAGTADECRSKSLRAAPISACGGNWEDGQIDCQADRPNGLAELHRRLYLWLFSRCRQGSVTVALCHARHVLHAERGLADTVLLAARRAALGLACTAIGWRLKRRSKSLKSPSANSLPYRRTSAETKNIAPDRARSQVQQVVRIVNRWGPNKDITRAD